MQLAITRIRLSLVALTLVSVIGCGKADQFGLVKVEGTVKLDGQPVSGAQVIFIPQVGTGEASLRTVESSGITDESGKYSLVANGGHPGAMIGDHKVVITKYVMKDGSPLPDPPDFAILGPKVTDLFPSQFSNRQGTTLTASVLGDDAPIDFDLKSK